MIVKPPRLPAAGLARAGQTRPARPSSVYAEDFSLLVRAPRRLRIARGRVRVLS